MILIPNYFLSQISWTSKQGSLKPIDETGSKSTISYFASAKTSDLTIIILPNDQGIMIIKKPIKMKYLYVFKDIAILCNISFDHKSQISNLYYFFHKYLALFYRFGVR